MTKTQVRRVRGDEFDVEHVREAAEVLSAGGLVVLPTETVYGLAARADIPAAIARLRKVKGREATKAFSVHIPGRDDVSRYVNRVSGVAERLMRKAWPGPLTLIFSEGHPPLMQAMKGKPDSALEAMYYDGTIGIRCPDDEIAQGVLRAVRAPVVAASANLAGKPAPVDGRDALKNLDGEVDLVLDAGRTKYAKPSTIVRLTNSGYELVREGVYDAAMLDRLAKLRILFVCTGNTCRSPMAEALAKKFIADRLGGSPDELPARGILVSSAGTAGGYGPAAEFAIEAMGRRSLNLTEHSSTALTVEMIQQADYIFVMTRAQRESVLRMSPRDAARVKLLLQDEDLNDPVGGTSEEYERCAQTIENSLAARMNEVDL